MLMFGCASVKPGNDTLLVRAEQTREAALETFDTFVRYENDNRIALWKVSPDIKHFADNIRSVGKASIQQLDGAIDDYKKLKTTVSSDKLNNTITFVATLTSRAFATMTQGKAALEISNKK